jgi:hypothetical protein
MVISYNFGCHNMVVSYNFGCRNMVITDDFGCRNMVVSDDFECRNMVVSDDFGCRYMVVTYDILTTQWSSLGRKLSLSFSESSQCSKFQSRKSLKSSLCRNFIAKMTYFFASCLSCWWSGGSYNPVCMVAMPEAHFPQLHCPHMQICMSTILGHSRTSGNFDNFPNLVVANDPLQNNVEQLSW